MIGKLLASGLMARVAVWAAGQALPSVSVLKSMLARLLTAIGCAVMGAVFFTAGLISGIIGLFVQFGQDLPEQAQLYWVVTLATVGLAMVMVIIARALIAQLAKDHQNRESVTHRAVNVVDDAYNLVVSGFLDGITASTKEHRKPYNEFADMPTNQDKPPYSDRDIDTTKAHYEFDGPKMHVVK